MSHNVCKKFGARVKKLRGEMGVSQEEFAKMCGFHRTYISLVERGKRNLGLQNIATIASVFDISISELTDGI